MDKRCDDNRLPWYIHATDAQPLVFAGVWQVWDKGENPLTTCAIVTTSANDAIGQIHHRMPVVLTPDQWGKWLGEDGKGAATLMKAAPDDFLTFHRVDRAVNSNKATGEALVFPL